MLISIVVFSFVILGLAGLSLQIADRTVKATDEALIMATELAASDRATAMSYNYLSTLLTPDTVFSGVIRVVVRFEVDSLSTTRKDVRIITQTSVPGMAADTMVIRRARVRYPIPLK